MRIGLGEFDQAGVESSGGTGAVLARQGALAQQPAGRRNHVGASAVDGLDPKLEGQPFRIIEVERAARERDVDQPGEHHLVGVADLPGDRQSLCAELPVPIGAALPAVQPGEADQRTRASVSRGGRSHQGPLDPPRPLDRVTAQHPIAPQAGRELDRAGWILRA